MPRETKAAKRERAIAVEDRMNVHYPEAEVRPGLRRRPVQADHRRAAVGADHRQGREQGDPHALGALPHPRRPGAGRRARRGGHHPHHRLLPHEGRQRHQMRADGGGRVRRRGAAHHGRAAAPSRRGPQDRQHRAERRLRHRGGHRRGHTRVPRGAQAEVQQRRHAVEDRSRPAEPVSARVLGAHQPPVGAVRPRGVHRTQAALRGMLPVRPSAPAAARSDGNQAWPPTASRTLPDPPAPAIRWRPLRRGPPPTGARTSRRPRRHASASRLRGR